MAGVLLSAGEYRCDMPASHEKTKGKRMDEAGGCVTWRWEGPGCRGWGGPLLTEKMHSAEIRINRGLEKRKKTHARSCRAWDGWGKPRVTRRKFGRGVGGSCIVLLHPNGSDGLHRQSARLLVRRGAQSQQLLLELAGAHGGTLRIQQSLEARVGAEREAGA